MPSVACLTGSGLGPDGWGSLGGHGAAADLHRAVTAAAMKARLPRQSGISACPIKRCIVWNRMQNSVPKANRGGLPPLAKCLIYRISDRVRTVCVERKHQFLSRGA
jgi:hypothetical protein